MSPDATAVSDQAAPPRCPVLTLVPFGSDLHGQMLAFRDLHLRRPLGLVQTAADTAGEEAQTHIAFVEQGAVRGTVLLKLPGGTVARLRQMAVSPELQGRGVGRQLVRRAEEIAREHGYRRMELHARMIARPFYERLGYQAFGPEFEEVTVLHVAMARDL